MAVIQRRSDLAYVDYSWTHLDDDDPKVSGEPDSTLLNRREGYEMVYFINKLCSAWNLKTIDHARKIESIIRENVPENIHSQEKIMAWIDNNWNKVSV